MQDHSHVLPQAAEALTRAEIRLDAKNPALQAGFSGGLFFML
jgi:hypothetical protein